jgi:hypothetical protein
MYGFQIGQNFSLLDMASSLFRDFRLKITKQSLHNRFTENAVEFLKSCLDHLVAQKIRYGGDRGILKSHFNRVRIKDSTKFALPDCFSAKYKGYGGALANSSSMISIQYEYDFLSGQNLDLRATDAGSNDQSDSANHTNEIREKDLFLRDLGYCTLGFLEMVNSSKAFFVSRLAPNVNIYETRDAKEPLDVNDFFKKLKKHKLEYMEVEVFVGNKKRLPVRAVVTQVDKDAYEKQLRKTTKQAKSTGNRVSKKYKSRAKLRIMITNVPKEILDAKNIREVYSLRWQIELLFKVWKSQVTIDEFSTSNIQRFDCQLFGKLIWIVLNLNIFNWLQQRVTAKGGQLCSVWKYFKHIFTLKEQLKEAMKFPRKLIVLMDDLVEIAPQILPLEKKRGKVSLNQSVKVLG